ncbi:hypothetical protein KAW50_01930 [candidate division WOR-3 bacterium]|nr:hypothetical protein [candidate division WOR-3 bacterium]
MWFLISLPIAILAGVTAGYHYTHRKTLPSLNFVAEGEKEKVLKNHGVKLGESTTCSVCGKKIDINNLGLLISEEEHVFICSDQRCMTLAKVTSPVSPLNV